MKKNNVGIIGCGYWGPNFVRNFNQMKCAVVKYVCDLDKSRMAHIKKSYPDIKTTQDYFDILNDQKVNAVVVATAANAHYRIAKDALLNDKNILVEKPIATNMKEAEELVEIARQRKKILMVGHTFEYNPGIRKLKEIVGGGQLGRIYYLYSRRTNLGPLRKDVSAMWDLAPHDISIFNYLLGTPPYSVMAKGARYLAHDLDDVCFISLDFPDNVLAHIHVSWLDPKKVREIVVVGSKKMAVFDDLNIDSPISVYDKSVIKKRFKQEYDSFEEFQMIVRSGLVKTPKINKAEPLQLECRHFIDCIQNKSTPLTDGYDGLAVLDVLTAIQKSLSKDGVKCSLSIK